MRKHPIHIGEMTEEIELHSIALTADGYGGATSTQTKYATVWAHIRPASGGEREEAMRLEGKGSFRIVIRNRSDVKERDVVKWGERYLNIRFIHARGNRDLYMEMDAEMGAPA